MAWAVVFKESVAEDLCWFGRKESRRLYGEILKRLSTDPQTQSKNLKTLRPNPVAQRELRLFGKYRVLFNVGTAEKTVTVVLVGLKAGEALLVRGKEHKEHHESRPSE